MGEVTFIAFGRVGLEFSLPTARAIALLGWLGLPPETAVCLSATDVRARCMRRLWRVRRNEGPLRPDVERLLELALDADEDVLVVG